MTKPRKLILGVFAVVVGVLAVWLEFLLFFWRTWCILHLDGVFVTQDGALRTLDGVSGIFITKM